jgi:DNA polymerase
VINFQAIPNDAVADTSARKCLEAPQGRVIVSADLSQIEPRVIAYLVGDADFLGLVRGGIDIYEAHGRASKLYNEDEPMAELAPEMRKLCKARLLGLGYGCGANTFLDVAKSFGVNMTEAEAKKQVLLYRAQNPDVVLAWSEMEDQFREWMKETPECITFTTRCGVPIRYFNAYEENGNLFASTTRGYAPVKIYGARLFQNIVQATARSIFADALIRIEAAGLPICLHVHDSVTLEVGENEGQAALDLLLQLLTEEPLSYPGLPLAAEGEIKTHY